MQKLPSIPPSTKPSQPIPGTLIQGDATIIPLNEDDPNFKMKNCIYVPDLRRNLGSVGLICDAGYQVLFTKEDVKILKEDAVDYQEEDVIIKGERDETNLYAIGITANNTEKFIPIPNPIPVIDPTNEYLLNENILSDTKIAISGRGDDLESHTNQSVNPGQCSAERIASNSPENPTKIINNAEIVQWHERLGHLSLTEMKKLAETDVLQIDPEEFKNI